MLCLSWSALKEIRTYRQTENKSDIFGKKSFPRLWVDLYFLCVTGDIVSAAGGNYTKMSVKVALCGVNLCIQIILRATSSQGDVIYICCHHGLWYFCVVICSHSMTTHHRWNFRVEISPKTKIACTYTLCTVISSIIKRILEKNTLFEQPVYEGCSREIVLFLNLIPSSGAGFVIDCKRCVLLSTSHFLTVNGSPLPGLMKLNSPFRNTLYKISQ